MRWECARRIARSPEDQKTCGKDGKRNEIDAQIGEYEMDQVIMELGSDENVLEVDKGVHGKAYTAMVSYPTTNG